MIKKYKKIISPLIIIMLGVLVVVYFVNNPGGKVAARLLNYQVILNTLSQHLYMVLTALGAAIIVAVPLGILITRPQFKKIVVFVDNLVNIGQTVPSLAVIALFYTILGLGFKTAVFALWIYSLLPILRNTSSGIRNVPKGIIEAAEGMGMSPFRILVRIEIPLALPVIMAGVRVSAVVCAGTAALATFISGGGLGDLIVTGQVLVRPTLLITGSSLTALLGILMDNIFGSIEDSLVNRGC